MDVPVESMRQNQIRDLRHITECPICTETYSDPRILPCIHSFCLRCLERSTEVCLNRQPGDLFPCPLCRKGFNIPSSGLSALQKNFFIESLVNILQVSALSERNITCDHCDFKGGKSMDKETISCVRCEKNFCKECYREHKQCGLAKDHLLASCASYGLKETIQQSEKQCCKQHVTMHLDLYCLECKIFICNSCYPENHMHHNVQHVNKVVNEVSKEIVGYTDKMNSFLKRLITRKHSMDEEKINFLKELGNIEDEVLSRSRQLIDIIKKATQTLLADLKAIQIDNLKEFDTHSDELERYLTAAESFKTYCNQIRYKQSPVAACSSIVDVRARADEILQFGKSQMLEKDRIIKVLLTDFEQEDFLKECSNRIGKVEAKVSEKLRDTSESCAQVQSEISVQFTAKLNIDYRRVFGVTTVQNHIYVLCQSPNVILVYEYQSPYVLKKEIKMKTTRSPFDIASSLKTGGLYIADSDNIIWKINVQDFKMSVWLRCARQPHKLSVSRQGNILLVNSDCSLSLHTEDSRLICKLQLPANIRQPMHACETSVGNVVICYKDGESLGICEMNRHGLVLHSSVSKEGLSIDGPLHLLLDSNDRALVSDFSNNRVIIFNSEFSKLKDILTEKKDEIFGPLGMCYDRDKQQLMVAHGAGLDGATQVFIYSLKLTV